MRLDSLCQSLQTIAARFERIFPDRAAPVQAVFGDSHGLAEMVQLFFEHAGPAIFKRQPLASVGNDSPGQGIRVNQNMEHVAILRDAVAPITPEPPNFTRVATCCTVYRYNP